MEVERGDPEETLVSELGTLSISPNYAADPTSDSKNSISLNDFCYDLHSLQNSAIQGSWLSVIEKISYARKFSLLQTPHENLIYYSYSVLALMKLRRFTEASDELDTMGDFDDAKYKYESHPQIYPNRAGSMVPFALRWLHAEIPHRLGKRSQTLDRLYLLLDFVRQKLNMRESGLLSKDIWRKREVFVIHSICGHHWSLKEFNVGLMLLRDVLRYDPDDVVLLSKIAYVQMQLGDVQGSNSVFDKIEKIVEERSRESIVSPELMNLVSRNKAFIYLISKDYVSAIREYEVCIERDDSDIIAINNKALCLLYTRNLSDSIKLLEGALERLPTIALTENLVVNLCSMYELAYVNHSDIKKTLSSWIARVAPDDFDSSCTRI